MEILPSAKKYKDSMFRHYFKDKERLLSLYSALTGDEKSTADDISITTLDGTMGSLTKNDLSFQIGDTFVCLFEHQSSWTENMPLRCFGYITRLWAKKIEEDDVYKRKLVKLPAPLFYVFYNGDDKAMDTPMVVQNLSDAFRVDTGRMNLTVEIYDIRYKENVTLLEKCRALSDYSFFVSTVKRYMAEGLVLEDAVRKAMRYCIEHDVMAEYLREHEMEVYDMLSFEYNPELAMKVAREEAKEEGREEEKENMAIGFLKAGVAINIITQVTNFSAEKIMALGKLNGVL